MPGLGLTNRALIALRALVGDPVGAVESLISTPAGAAATAKALTSPRSKRAAALSGNVAQQLLASFMPGTIRQYPKRTTADLLQAYSELPALRVCVNLVASNYAKIAWQLYAPSRSVKNSIYAKQEIDAFRRGLYRSRHTERRKVRAALIRSGDLKPILASPLLDFLEAGCPPYLTGLQVRKLNQAYQMLAGETFVAMERNGAGAPIQAVPIPPVWVNQIPAVGDNNFYVRGFNGALMKVPAEDMLWRKHPDPYNPFGRGTGQAGAVSTELETDEAVAQTQRNRFTNGARPDLLIWGNLGGTEQVKQLKTKWLNDLQGFMKSGLPYFYDTGEADPTTALQVKDLSASMEALQTTAIRGETWTYIREVMGSIPPELLGITGSSNRATIETAYYILARNTLEPIAEEECAFLQQRLVPEYDDRLIVDFESPVEEDRDFELKVMQAFPYSSEIDEMRNLRHAPPLENDEGKVKPLPMTITMVKDLGADPFASAPARGPAMPGAPKPPEPDTPGVDPEPATAGPKSAADAGRRFAEWNPAWARQVATRRGVTIRAVSTVVSMERIATKMAPKLRGLFIAAVQQAQVDLDLKELEHRLAAGLYHQALDLLPTAGMSEAMLRAEGQFLTAMKLAGDKASADLVEGTDADLKFDPSHAGVKQWTSKRSSDLAAWIAESTRRAASELIENEFLGGDLSVSEVATEIKARLGLTPRDSAAVGTVKSEALAQGSSEEAAGTKATAYVEELFAARAKKFGDGQSYEAVQEGQRQAWMQATKAGVLPSNVKRYWLTQEDAEVCPTCESMDGQERGLAEAFTGKVKVGGKESTKNFMNPGDPHSDTCRCGALILYARGAVSGEEEAAA